MQVQTATNSLRTRQHRNAIRFLIRIVLATTLLSLAVTSLRAQTGDASSGLSIRLEQKKGDIVQAAPQNTVFHSQDVLRFRIVSRIDGYLYVIDRGTSGTAAMLFPGTNSTGNHIERNHTYTVPADGDGWFQVSGPAGFDVLYFLLSAAPISLPNTAPEGSGSGSSQPPPAQAPADLLPRCDDAIFRARGECVDVSAGVAPLGANAAVPRELIPLARTASRDIVLADDDGDTTVEAAPSAKLPLIYTFRLAHRE